MQLTTTTLGSGSRSVALVHGMSASSLHWSDVARLLVDEHDCTVTLVDLRGHGDSPRADRYAVDDFSDDLVDTLPHGARLPHGAVARRAGRDDGGRAPPTEAADRPRPRARATKAFESSSSTSTGSGDVLPDAGHAPRPAGQELDVRRDDALARVKAGRKMGSRGAQGCPGHRP